MRWVPNAVIAFLRQAQDRQKRSAPNRVVWSKRMHIVIIANAPALDITPYRAAIDAADIVIAADGGALPLRDAERLPDLVIGDMTRSIRRRWRRWRSAALSCAGMPARKTRPISSWPCRMPP